jgi:hypothetical protein
LKSTAGNYALPGIADATSIRIVEHHLGTSKQPAVGLRSHIQ